MRSEGFTSFEEKGIVLLNIFDQRLLPLTTALLTICLHVWLCVFVRDYMSICLYVCPLPILRNGTRCCVTN